jgi:3-oxoacyl-[acyl-carrier protein] reductase
VNDYVAERADAVADEIRAGGVARRCRSTSRTSTGSPPPWTGSAGSTSSSTAKNAGVEGFNFGPFVDRADDWHRYFAVNLFGVMHCTRAALPGMIHQAHGRVITIVSMPDLMGRRHLRRMRGQGRGGGIHALRWLASRAVRHHANNVALGSIDTTGLAAARRQSKRRTSRKQLRSYHPPFGRPTGCRRGHVPRQPTMASWITGQTCPRRGGYTVSQ